MITPEYLYKVVTVEEWKVSQGQAAVQTGKNDKEFIHLATEEQLSKIIEKFYADIPEYVILKISSKALRGRLVFESNPGGITKYYHLYDGFIPLKSVIESKAYP